MSLAIIDTIQASLVGFGGSMYLVAIGIMIFFIIAFLIAGLPFKYAIMFTSPLSLGFVEIGWFPPIINLIFWLLIAGIGIFVFISAVSDR